MSYDNGVRYSVLVGITAVLILACSKPQKSAPPSQPQADANRRPSSAEAPSAAPSGPSAPSYDMESQHSADDGDSDLPRQRRRVSLHPAKRFETVAEGERIVDQAKRNLADGELVSPCGKLLEIYDFSRDGFDIGYFPQTQREGSEADRFQDHCQRLLEVCLGYYFDEGNALFIARERLKSPPASDALKLSLGLILSRSDKTEERREAHEVLERLAQQGKVPRAEGYAALARLRHQAGDEKGTQAALAACRARTRRQGVCPSPAELLQPQPHLPTPSPSEYPGLHAPF